MLPPKITIHNIKEAQKAREQDDPRDLFYRASTILVTLALDKKIDFSVIESVAVLLRTWNKMNYRFGKKFDADHYRDIEQLFQKHLKSLQIYRKLTIENLDDNNEQKIKSI